MVTIFTKNNCVACKRTKKLLKDEGIEYTEINVDEQPVWRLRLLEEGWQSMPVVKTAISSWSGYQPEKIRVI